MILGIGKNLENTKILIYLCQEPKLVQPLGEQFVNVIKVENDDCLQSIHFTSRYSNSTY